MILLELLAQGASIDTKAGGGSGLIVVAMTQHGLEHGLFDFRNNGVE